MKTTCCKLGIWIGLTMAVQTHAALWLARDGQAEMRIVVDPEVTPPEALAARELASTLAEIAGAPFTVETNRTAPRRAIVVGSGALSRQTFPAVEFDRLGEEEWVMRTEDDRLLLAGGRPRGTLYAVSRFLQQQCGVRWWTPWARHVPQQTRLRIESLDIRERPAFEYRESFWYPAFDGDWSWKNLCNGQSTRLTTEQGGRVTYKGFVHTFYPLVPPEEHFAAHPEWFSLVNGQRTTNRAQLCLTHPGLREFMVKRVKEWLRESPDAGILSVSQNDWYGACTCDPCRALDDNEGSQSGTMLDFVNHIAASIESEFPRVAIDTLAYQYTRKPPRTLTPRPNVIVRLCSIECNFREPLDHPSNAAFAADIRGWAARADRLYIWDYTTDFAHYLQPHPNWFVLGANLRFFQAHHVRGVFEQGAYQSHGSEMAELRAWVLAQLLRDPQQNDQKLIDEFLRGYYGPAARDIRAYLDWMHAASAGTIVTCFARPQGPHLGFRALAEAERLWQRAAEKVAGNPELAARVQVGHLPVRYAFLTRWNALREECEKIGGTWPLATDPETVLQEWLVAAKGDPARPWTQVTLVNERGDSPDTWAKRLRGQAPTR